MLEESREKKGRKQWKSQADSSKHTGLSETEIMIEGRIITLPTNLSRHDAVNQLAHTPVYYVPEK